jgi:hypothetical protein
MRIWPRGLDDLLDEPSTAYHSFTNEHYDAEKGLLELYRNFVSEMLRMSLAGVAVIGFLSKFLKDGGPFTCQIKYLGILSMSSFALSSILALLFLYASAEGYRYYVAGLRSKLCDSDISPEEYLAKRKQFTNKCVWSKAGSAILLAVGAISACIAIFLIL